MLRLEPKRWWAWPAMGALAVGMVSIRSSPGTPAPAWACSADVHASDGSPATGVAADARVAGVSVAGPTIDSERHRAADVPAWSAGAGPEPQIHVLPESVARMEPWRREHFCPGDFNKDDLVDGADVALFMSVYTAREGPMVPWLDVNKDGQIDERDVDAFLEAFWSNSCDTIKMREYRFVIC